ncbi:18251_t:CDS:1, partial [Funneliformis geosporum]
IIESLEYHEYHDMLILPIYFTDAEHKMFYLIVGAVVIDWAKVTIEKIDNKEKPNMNDQQQNQETK